LKKIPIATPPGGILNSKVFSTKSSSNRKKELIGISCPGKIIRLMPFFQFEQLLNSRTSEIFRLPLFPIVLSLFSVGISPKNIFSNKKLQEKISSLESLLLSLSAIRPNNSLTSKGKFCLNMPLSIQNSSVLFDWIFSKRNPFPAILACCCIDAFGPTYFSFSEERISSSTVESRPSNLDISEKILLTQKRYFEQYRSSDDLEVYLKVLQSFLRETNFEISRIDSLSISKFSREKEMSTEKIRDLVNLVFSSINVFRRISNIPIEIADFDLQEFVSSIRPLFASAWFDRILVWNEKGYSLSSNSIRYSIDIKSLNTIVQDNVSKFIGVILENLNSERGIVSFAIRIPEEKILIPISTQSISETGYSSSVEINRPVTVPKPIDISKLIFTLQNLKISFPKEKKEIKEN
jgi:hypothetical protein